MTASILANGRALELEKDRDVCVECWAIEMRCWRLCEVRGRRLFFVGKECWWPAAVSEFWMNVWIDGGSANVSTAFHHGDTKLEHV